jgi:hypothetical protein
MLAMTRRDFIGRIESAAAAGVLGLAGGTSAQTPGERPIQAVDVEVLNPATRVPVRFIIDDSTCLVNLNRFAMPQFDEAFGGKNRTYARDWRSWPAEIPDSFVRTFGTWCAEHGVKGKYSIVPYPACVGRLDRGLPGWTRRELADSIELVRTLMVPNKAEIPHYFRDAVAEGPGSVAPRVENASDLDGADPRCVVSVVACTGDWTGGWDNTPPGGADRFITADLASGRMVEVIERGDVAVMMSHWTGIYWDGQAIGFKIFQEVVRRLHAKFDNLVWMKLSEIARYAAARALTRIDAEGGRVRFRAPFACPAFTFRVRPDTGSAAPTFRADGVDRPPFTRVQRPLDLSAGTWSDTRDGRVICLDLPRGRSEVVL